jgi:hypothetical protein
VAVYASVELNANGYHYHLIEVIIIIGLMNRRETAWAIGPASLNGGIVAQAKANPAGKAGIIFNIRVTVANGPPR